jgi:predicted ArsR family transcriptional regulator
MQTFEMEELWRSAKAFHGDALFNELMKRLEQRYMEQWRNSPPDQASVREDAYNMVRAVSALSAELSALAAEKKVADFNARLKRA